MKIEFENNLKEKSLGFMTTNGNRVPRIVVNPYLVQNDGAMKDERCKIMY